MVPGGTFAPCRRALAPPLPESPMNTRPAVVLALLGLAAPASLAAPEFVHTPFTVPEGVAGPRPSVLFFGHVLFEDLDIIQMGEQVSEATAAFEQHAVSPTSGATASYTVGLEYDATSTYLLARCYSTADVVTTTEGESSELFASANVDSPNFTTPRFTLTEPALVHARLDARSSLEGTINTNNTSFFLAHGHGQPSPSTTLYQASAPSHAQGAWSESIDELVLLDAGDYFLQMYVVHLGTAATLEGIGFLPEMHADGESRVELRILPGCSLADLAEPFGSHDFSDVIAFLGAFAAGCP